jgi:hypothetical protein
MKDMIWDQEWSLKKGKGMDRKAGRLQSREGHEGRKKPTRKLNFLNWGSTK